MGLQPSGSILQQFLPVHPTKPKLHADKNPKQGKGHLVHRNPPKSNRCLIGQGINYYRVNVCTERDKVFAAVINLGEGKTNHTWVLRTRLKSPNGTCNIQYVNGASCYKDKVEPALVGCYQHNTPESPTKLLGVKLH